MKLYKLTDQNMRTYAGFQWELSTERTATGGGPLCTNAWLHAYTDPLLAVLLNPIHADIQKPRLFECDGDVGATDHGLKVGCTALTLKKEMPLPETTTEQRVRFGILCAKEVCRGPAWLEWADAWLDGDDRSARAAAEATAWSATRAAAWSATRAAAEAAAWAAAGKRFRPPRVCFLLPHTKNGFGPRSLACHLRAGPGHFTEDPIRVTCHFCLGRPEVKVLLHARKANMVCKCEHRRGQHLGSEGTGRCFECVKCLGYERMDNSD